MNITEEQIKKINECLDRYDDLMEKYKRGEVELVSTNIMDYLDIPLSDPWTLAA